jgi:sugar (pentulose or hexulose) kinase
MMHGYMAFDKDGHLLALFRTWRNTNTGAASAELAEEVAKLLDPSGKLQAGIPLCPPEGDACNMVWEK